MTKKERNHLICAREEEGYSQEEIGRFYNLSQSSISIIVLNKKRGIGEKTEETRGAKSRLTALELEKLSVMLKEVPSEKGFSYWNKWSVKSLIKEEFKVDYHENYVWKIMQKIGFSSQLPQKKDYRQNEDKVRAFKEEKVIGIKKSEG